MKTFPIASVLALGVALAACTPPAEPVVPPGPSVPPPAAEVTPPPEAPPPQDPAARAKVDEIVAKHIAARGGAEAIAAIKSVRTTGKIRFGGGDGTVEVEWGAVQKRPGVSRSEVTFQGITAVDGFDGTEAWSTAPFEGRTDPFKQSADEVRLRSHEADLEGPLVGWEAKGHRLEYLGTEEVDGTMAHKLRVVRKDGDVEIHYLDPDAWLEVRTVTIEKVRGVERVSEADYGDYEKVSGVYFPFAIASGRKGEPKTTRIRIERVETNVAVEDASFAFPKTKVARAITAGSAAKGETAAATPAAKGPAGFDGGAVSGLSARNIGSAAMSGRVSAVAAHVDGGKTIVYVGAASGGVWKSPDGGTTFKPIFDKQPVQSIGAITIDPSNPKNLWVGTGEAWTRNSVSIGNGVYRSTDAGETWQHVGLPEAERIVQIVVHPKNGNVVYACVPGKLWSDSPDRGVYKTSDAGKTWSQVLKGKNLSTGCSGLTMDPSSPDTLMVGMWDFRRKGWTYRSGGEGPDAASGSGMLRTVDGGANWTTMDSASNKGLPSGPWGRLDVAIAPSDPKIVYAVIESKDSALYRSDDGGATWEKRDASQRMVWRPFYFSRLIVDPKNPERLFKPNLELIVSEDGGRSFSSAQGGSHGDWHDVWIDPTNPKHVIGGDDGGFWTSFDGGSRWVKSNNLPISQFYHATFDMKDPYQVYGGLQDNSTWVGDSQYPGGVSTGRWENLYNGDGFWAVVDPTDPDAVYVEMQGGYIGRVDRRTHTARDIQPKANYGEKLRFNWNTPIHASRAHKGTIYLGAQFLFRTKDRGETWERVSPDLTTNDPEKQKQELSGGITVDNSSAEMHTTIYSISESPKDGNVIWVGTDDGNLQLSRDGGKKWTNVVGNVPGLPKASWVSWVEASRFDANTAYAAFDRHTFGDMTPWVFRTTDAGKTWTRIATPEQGVRGYAHVVREDVVSSKLLFVGTELGLFISIDGGATFAEFKGRDFPSVAVRDVDVHPRDHDLLIATHGRGMWIVDDVSPLRKLTADVLARGAAFLEGRPVEQRIVARGGWVEGDAQFVGENPPGGATITYYQRNRHLFGRLSLEVLDASGKLVDTLDPTTRRGINRVQWSMQEKPPLVPRAAQVAGNATQGPRVLPGTYTLRLSKGGERVETKLSVSLDRRAHYTAKDRRAQHAASMRVHAMFGEMSGVVERIERTRAAIAGALEKADGPLADKLRAASKKLEEAKKKIVATKEGGAITGEERIREHTDLLYGALLSHEGKPAKYLLDRTDVLRRELDDVKKEVEGIMTADVKSLDGELKAKGLGAIPTDGPTADWVDQHERERELAEARRCILTRGERCEETSRAAREKD